MKFKWCEIDPETATSEEIKNEIERLDDLVNVYENKQMAIKIFINSVYGACGSPWFTFYNMDIAEAVTLQGQDLIKYSEKVINHYFLNFWHKDEKLHKKLGLFHVERVTKPLIVYCDTDSNFVSFKEILDNCDWKGSPKEFILKIYKEFLNEYLGKCYDIYAKKFGTKNYQKFELEKISDSGIWLAKKKYVYNVVWKEPGIDVEPFTNITAKGVEIVQSSSSKFARDTMNVLMKYILEKKKNFNIVEFASLLKKVKNEYCLKSIEDVAASNAVGNYEKFVMNDKDKVVLEKGCPIHVRGSAIYNNKLLNSKYKKKYTMIRSGEKVKYYYVKTRNVDENIFSFIPGSFPIEFAPPIDYDVQFEKSIIHPLNRFVECMGYPAISGNLIVTTQLF